MKLMLAAIATVILASGCASINYAEQAVATGVNTYCNKLSFEERAIVYQRINNKAFPDTIDISCFRDALGNTGEDE